MVLELQIFAVIGLLLSIYAYHVEKKSEKQANYHAVCDISDKFQCSKVVGSEYGKTAGVSNSIGGALFYILVFILTFFNISLIFYLAILSIFGSLYLAYIQYFIIKKLCLICSSIYVVNILLLIFSYTSVF